MVKVAIFGSSGYLGNKCAAFFKGSLCFSRRTGFDLQNPKIEASILQREGVSHAFLLAGWTNVKRCEEKSEDAWKCNVEGSLEWARQIDAIGITPVLFSSDYVFNGKSGNYRENSVTDPLNAYGKQKKALEDALMTLYKDQCLIIRLSKVFEITGNEVTWVDKLIAQLRKAEEVTATTDQLFSPICIDDLIHGISHLCHLKYTGLFHLCGPEILSYFIIATKIAKQLSLSSSLIRAISLEEWNDKILRPKTITMNGEKFLSKTSLQLEPVTSYIERVFKRK